MIWNPQLKPRLRPVEAFLVEPDGEGQRAIGLRDRTGLSDVVLTVSPAALELMAMMDGTATCAQIRTRFAERFEQPVAPQTIASMLDHLERALFLEGESFERHYQSLVDDYRRLPARDMPRAADLGIVDDSGDLFTEMLAEAEPRVLPGLIRGVIAPHLDYLRGRPCYAAAYGVLENRRPPDRVVILGTNHFGRSPAVVATAKDFATPLGTTRGDAGFLEKLEARCGDLRRFELDHAREHSVELQVAWLQHLFGAERFTIVPVLCPDPCGPTGTSPYNGEGVDLRDFARGLAEVMAADGGDTLLVAGADLSHVGTEFGDERDLDEEFLAEVRRRDQGALAALEAGSAEGFRRIVADGENPTRVCSAGCMFTLASALPDATPALLGYHQAVTREIGNCVTCCAAAYCE